MSGMPVADSSALPNHVAIIMDGNGRWAAERGLPRILGHHRGADVVRDITTFARELGLSHLTLFSFSRQNWRRPPAEVTGLMKLLEDYCLGERETLMKHDVRLNTIGRLSRLPSAARRALEVLVDETAGNRGMTLTLAVDYGGREEIVTAVKRLAQDLRNRRVSAEQIDESLIAAHLDTALMPDPDLVIRTSGEMRVSNFLLWQLAYAELYFTEVRWPEFSRDDFAAALRAYASRERRFGATSQQLLEVGTEGSEGFELGDFGIAVAQQQRRGFGSC